MSHSNLFGVHPLSQALPPNLYTAEQCQQLDRVAIDQFGIPGIRLMKRAGQAAFDCLLAHWPEPERITVFCGGGNNGGDGYIVAALAAQQHIPVTLFYLSDPKNLKGDAGLARDFAEQAGVVLTKYSSQQLEPGVVVDAMLGTGSKGAPREAFEDAINAINCSGLPVMAIDLPSGLCADTGSCAGEAIQAETTITFISLKRGLFTAKGPVCCGEVCFDDLEVPAEVYTKVASDCYWLNHKPLPRRAVDAHKGSSGHVLVVGGDQGFGGAVLMAAEAAARCGAGLVSVATQTEHVAPILSRCPEVMVKAVDSTEQLLSLIDKATVIVCGPGLGQSNWSKAMLAAVLGSSKSKVIDADGLNLLNDDSTFRNLHDDNWVLTPHPGEAARLLSSTTEAIQKDRFAAIQKLQSLRGGIAILKGVGTLVASSQSMGLCRAGNPGMGSGGMGDILSGVIGALIAQGLDLKTAAEMGVQFHAQAADRAAERGERGLMATDLLPHLRSLVNGL